MLSWKPATPPDERERQAAVDKSGILGRGGDAELQRIVDSAARSMHAPMAAISIIDRERQWFPSRVGIDDPETSRDLSFCAHAIHRPGEPLVVEDAAKDARFSSHPLVTDNPNIRFYAGVPLVTQAGYPLGALCVADTEPRRYRPVDLYDLTQLARRAERVIGR